MAERRLRPGGGDELSPDQRAVFDAYFDRPGVVCTPAGSGTGKTTTAVETVAEAVVRELERDPDRNPFEAILVTTFTKDAARQLKAELKERLREHREAAPADDPVARNWTDLLRWLETASNVRTIDSFTQDLLREVALEAGVAPSFGIADGIRRSDLLEEIFEDLRGDPDLQAPIERLEEVFPADADHGNWEAMVEAIHRNCREFCLPVEDARRELLRSVTEMHAGRDPEDFEDVLAIVEELADYDADFVRTTIDDREAWAAHAAETYRTTRRIAGDFGVVLAAFDQEYDRLSRSRGVLSHTDVTHVVREYLADGPPTDERGPDGDGTSARRDRFGASLASRYRHVVVDEFQDTSYAQCRILAHLLDGANALLIGDLKQSIYEWRSAEPRLFSEVIEYADGESEDNVLDAETVHRVPLTENFRSHPHLVRAANHVFPRVFSDPGRGAIGTFDVEYDPLDAERLETQPEEAHVHALRIPEAEADEDQSRRAARVEREAERVAGVLRRALDEGSLRVDREQRTRGEPPSSEDLDPVRAGDVAILFRSTRYMRLYSEVLDRYGIDNAVIGSHSLFREPEIEALIDALGWLGRPDDARATRRMVESPVSGVSAAGVARCADYGYDLDRAIAGWDGGERDLRELRALAEFRDGVSTDAPKAQVVSDLLVHSAFDVAALADRDGLQRYANLRRFVEVVDGWEDDELLSYGEFMRRLERLRQGRVDDDTTLAAIADMDSAATVKLLTAHTAKGLEFPVVVLADTTHDERYRKVCDEPFVADRRHGVALRPTTGDSHQPADGEFPTFSGGWFHEDDSEYDYDRGLLWVSELRDSDGRIRHHHPFREYVQDRRAEFWRLLYVAFTRAGDHLVVPFPARRGGEWTTWAAALGEYLDPGEGDLATDDGPVPVGIDDLEPADPPASTSVDLDDLLAGVGGEDPSDPAEDPTRRFRPRSLSATGVKPLLEDPREFQRTVLRGVGAADPAREEGVERDTGSAPGDHAGPPGSLPPDDWGEVVHRTLEAIHDAADPEATVADPDRLATLADRAVTDVVGDHPDADRARERIRADVIPAYRGTDTWTAATAADVALPEFGAVAPAPSGARPTFLRGRIDLLYRNDGWRIADFKTGRPTARGSERHDTYRTQLSAYAWLLDAVYGLDVVGARLVYLPVGEEKPVDVGPGGFEAKLAGIDELYVDHEGVLRRSDGKR